MGWLPVTWAVAFPSSTSDAASAKSPAKSLATASESRATGSSVSAPAWRASSTRRTENTCQVSSSQSSNAVWQASQSQRISSSFVMDPPRSALSARFNIGVAAGKPSVIASTQPSRR